MTRPTIRKGDEGQHVVTVQTCLRASPIDGDFGTITEDAVIDYQRRGRLDADGIVGPETWAALETDFNLPPYPPPMVPPLDERVVAAVIHIAENSQIAGYDWDDRGEAPIGYTKGVAVSFAYVVKKWYMGDPAAIEMAKANTGNTSKDALAYYADVFDELHMDNDAPGLTTLRHLWVLLLGLGMRESSGRHCEGRDMSASNTSSDTAEAGLYQTSWNASSCSDLIPLLMEQYGDHPPQCQLPVFSEDVSCSDSDWSCYGSGTGYEYQALAKSCPAFAAEMTAIGLRNLRQHWGPIGRFEVEVRPEADAMLLAVQSFMSYLHRLSQPPLVS